MTLKTRLLTATLAAFMPIAAFADTAANKALAVEALTETLLKGNVDSVDKYFAPSYIQHNPDVPSGSEAFKGLVTMLNDGPGIDAEIARVIADDDMVAIHARYTGFGPTPMIAFDVFRIENGMIVEHWDNLIEEQPLNPSGRSQIDGATEITDLDKTEANKAKVTEFLTRSMINHEEVDITNYISPVTYLQHNPMVADGLDGFGAFMGEMAKQGITMEYAKVHHVIGEGNFVLSLSEGSFGGEAQAFYDLFRLEDGLIVEHWDIIAPMPGPDAKHNEAGKF
ncbi:MAG: nuclear transport factor 2 family protein [Litoreibacter sp.]|nr:nuclear transport factor 2 family protein [Litoreibacter sp.]MCY4334255.1 nuclear transport factor 2 family protein [Litoreibacter sp.]